jgi:radical SAM superfamily enzyme YgiQ (UPF0313 family)
MKLDRVFLIQPKISLGENVVPYHPLVGLGVIAEFLEQNGKQYDIVDMQLGHSFRYLKKKIRKFAPHLIGISLMTFRYLDNYNLISNVKKAFPKIPIVTGGPHVMTFGKKLLEQCQAVDFAVYGEGEETLLELCNGKELSQIRGLIYRKDDHVIFNGPRNNIIDPDTLAFPKYRKWELDKYVENYLPPKFMVDMPKKANNRMIALFTSRGCPFSCIFCLHAFGRRWRGKSARLLADEIEYWYKKGYRQFPIIDDNFTLDKERVYELAEEIKRRGLTNLKLSAPSGLRADAVNKDLLKVMKETGFNNVSLAVESASPKVLEIMKKGETIATIEKAIRDSIDVGLEVTLFFVIGTPGETIDDVKTSINFAKKFPIDARFYNLIPYPNTELFDIVDKSGSFITQPEVYLNYSSLFVHTVYETPEIPSSERDRLIKEEYEVKKRIREKCYRKDYGTIGLMWAKLTFLILPIMTFVWNLSPPLYRLCVKIYGVYRKIIVAAYKRRMKLRSKIEAAAHSVAE